MFVCSTVITFAWVMYVNVPISIRYSLVLSRLGLSQDWQPPNPTVLLKSLTFPAKNINMPTKNTTHYSAILRLYLLAPKKTHKRRDLVFCRLFVLAIKIAGKLNVQCSDQLPTIFKIL
jgi:hypothetical protein